MDGLAWPDEPPRLTDGVVHLRQWGPQDADAVFRACQDPQIQRWTRVRSPYERTDAEHFVTVSAEQWADRTAAPFAVVDAADQVLASMGLVTVTQRDLHAEIGYWVAPWARRRSVAARAAALVADWAFSSVGFVRLELYIEVDNVASRAVAERIGAVAEGVLRSRALHRGAQRDVVVYGLLP